MLPGGGCRMSGCRVPRPSAPIRRRFGAPAAGGAVEAVAHTAGARDQPITRPRRHTNVPGQPDNHRSLGLGDEEVVAHPYDGFAAGSGGGSRVR